MYAVCQSGCGQYGYLGHSRKRSATFDINPKNAGADSQLKVPDIAADTSLDNLVLKDGDKMLVQGTDYVVTKVQDGNKVTVTITFSGNYTAMLTAFASGAIVLLKGRKRKE